MSINLLLTHDPTMTTGVEFQKGIEIDFVHWAFLHELFEELYTKTGQRIDIYDDATFYGQQLSELKDTLNKALQLVKAQPNQWTVVIGWENESRTQEIREPVTQEEFLTLLNRLLSLVDQSVTLNKYLLFIGD